MHICTLSLPVLLPIGTMIFLIAVTWPGFGIEFKNAWSDTNEVRAIRTVSMINETSLGPLTIVLSSGNDLANEYSITTAMACQRKIISDSSLRSHHLLSIYYMTGTVHNDIWHNIIIILYLLVMDFYL